MKVVILIVLICMTHYGCSQSCKQYGQYVSSILVSRCFVSFVSFFDTRKKYIKQQPNMWRWLDFDDIYRPNSSFVLISNQLFAHFYFISVVYSIFGRNSVQQCQYHYECCSNNCLTFSYKCIHPREQSTFDISTMNSNAAFAGQQNQNVSNVTELVNRIETGSPVVQSSMSASFRPQIVMGAPNVRPNNECFGDRRSVSCWWHLSHFIFHG